MFVEWMNEWVKGGRKEKIKEICKKLKAFLGKQPFPNLLKKMLENINEPVAMKETAPKVRLKFLPSYNTLLQQWNVEWDRAIYIHMERFQRFIIKRKGQVEYYTFRIIQFYYKYEEEHFIFLYVLIHALKYIEKKICKNP